MSTALRHLPRQRHPALAFQAYWDCFHFGRTGLMTIAQLEDRLLASAEGIPKQEAIAAIRRGMAAAHRQIAWPLNDPIPF